MRLSVAPLSAADEALLASIRPAEEFPRDVALFKLAGLITFTFCRNEVTRMAGGFGWMGHLRGMGINPACAFDRFYRDGSLVVAVWCPAARREGRAS